MTLNNQMPVFRKFIIPCYDSDTACYITILLMIIVFLFGMTGIFVANDTPQYNDYVWIPILLVILSFIVIVSTSIRLIIRYIEFKRSSEID